MNKYYKKIQYLIIIIMFSFLLINISESQVSENWIHRYTGPLASSDSPSKFVIDSSGNMYVTGKTLIGGGFYHIVTVKYNSSGVRQWIAKFTNGNLWNNEGVAVQVDSAGNVYVSGTTRLSAGQFDIILIKYNSNGVQQWLKQFNGTGSFDDFVTGSVLDGKGNIYLSGYSFGTGSGYDYLLLKYNSAGTLIWSRTWNGPSNSDDYARGISLTSDGKIILSGSSYSSVTRNDFVTIKYDTSGSVMWNRNYNAPASLDDVFSFLRLDPSDNVYITGKSKGTGIGNDYATVKYNSSGTLQWSMRYDGPSANDDIPVSLDIDNSGNVYVTGYSFSSSSLQDYLTVKYNSGGAQQWVKNYNGVSNFHDRGVDIKTDASGFIYVTGRSQKISDGTSDVVTLKYNSSGDVIWSKTYNGLADIDDDPLQIIIKNNNLFLLCNSTRYLFSPFLQSSFDEAHGSGDYLVLNYNLNGDLIFETNYDGAGIGDDQAVDMITNNADNCFVTGFSTQSFSGYDYVTIKYSSALIPVWVSRYDGTSGTDKSNSITSDNSGNIYVTGQSAGTGTGVDIATIKYNAEGTEQWVSRYNGAANGNDYGVKVVADNSGNVIVSGYSDSTGFGKDFITIKYNSSGVQQWRKRYNGPGNSDDYVNSMVVDSSGNIFVTGKSIGSGTLEDIATVKYNSSGVQQWVSRYNGTGNNSDEGNSIKIDNTGNIIVTGKSKNVGLNFDMITIKYNSSGTQQWIMTYNGTSNSDDEASSVTTDNTGNIFVTGYSKNLLTNEDFTTLKYNSSGVQQWFSNSNGTSNGLDKASSIASDISGNVFVTGFCNDLTSNLNYCTIKYNTNGEQKWLEKFSYQDNDTDKASVVKVDTSGNVFVTGMSKALESAADFLTLKYKQNKTLELKAYIEGFYDNVNNTMISDSVQVILRNSVSPYNVIDSSVSILSNQGKATFVFQNAQNGVSYYLILNHRNSIETWSSAVNIFQSGSMSYDFTTGINKAYGNNLILKGSKYCIYSGDVERDGIIDAADISTVDNGVIVLLKGRTQGDLNGDEIIDVSDLSIVENNSAANILIVRP